MNERRVAIVGCGAAGLAAAYSLRGSNLTLYEKNSALGGHAATVEVRLSIVGC